MTSEAIKRILNQTEIIATNQNELERTKGEKFNIFSIIGVERMENNTHSAFIAELLNPKGTHFQGNAFLDMFLAEISAPEHHINTRQARVQREKSVGVVNDTVGGRIDIVITDNNGNTIAIENKIDAGDQPKQIQRYYNYNRSKNKVYYLTLLGDEPDKESSGDLTNGEHYFIISYKHHIINWLKNCVKYVADQPILRESIKQYIILIQKLTKTMDNKHQDELIKVILNNCAEAEFIAQNLEVAKRQIFREVKLAVFTSLKENLSEEFYDVVSDENASSKFSQIWIKLRKYKTKLRFGIESFNTSGHFGGNLYVGICNPDQKQSSFINFMDNKHDINGWWINSEFFDSIDDYEVNFKSPHTIQKIYTDVSFKQKFINQIVEKTCTYINDQYPSLENFLQQSTLID